MKPVNLQIVGMSCVDKYESILFQNIIRLVSDIKPKSFFVDVLHIADIASDGSCGIAYYSWCFVMGCIKEGVSQLMLRYTA